MAYNIHFKVNPYTSSLPTGSHYIITGVDRPLWPEDVEKDVPMLSGQPLESSEGFPYKMEDPMVSFKVFRSLCNKGLADVASSIVTTRRRSRVTPTAVWNGVKNFFGKPPARTTLSAYYDTLAEVRRIFKPSEKYIPRDMDYAMDRLPANTSPGLPYINTYKGLKKGEVYVMFSHKIKSYWTRVGNREPVVPLPDCAAFARSHIGRVTVNKVRPVWAYPLDAVVEEARFASPIIDALINQDIGRNTAYGCEMMKGGMAWINGQAALANSRYPGCRYFMSDYSSFDTAVPAWMIRDVFSIIEENMDFSRVRTRNSILDVDEECQRRRFRRCVNYFINTPIRNCDGRRFQKDHGVPSGSMFTNIIDTMANMLATRTIMKLVTKSRTIFDLYFGDDGLVCFEDGYHFDIDQFILAAREIFGLEVKPGKSYMTTRPQNMHFLGYYNNYGHPVKDPEDLIAAMLFPQYFSDDWGYCVSRALGCILAGAGTNMDTFLAGQAVYDMAVRHDTKVADGIKHIMTNPRARRHLSQMGYGDVVVTDKYFSNINESVPLLTCSKLKYNVQLVE